MKKAVNTRKVKRRRQANRQLFLLAKELQDLAKTLRRPVPASPANGPAQKPDKTDILLELYHGNYLPSSNLSRKNDPLDQNARKTLDALYTTLSPEQKKLYLQYEAAENTRGAVLSERAYRDGFCLAIQLIWAGRMEPAETE